MIKIIAVDDEPAFIEVLGIYLKEFGEFEVVTYSSADQALENLAIEQVDAIISDYFMAGMDGITFFHEVKSRNPDIPFLLLTGRDDSRLIIEALNAGVDFIQFKGEDPSLLFADIAQKIRSSVDKYRAQQKIAENIRERELFISVQRDLMNRLSTATTLNQAADACLTSIRYLASCTRGSIHLYNPATNKNELLISHNLQDDLLRRFSFGDIHKVFFTKKSQYFFESGFSDHEIITGGQIPIPGGEQIIGVLSFMIDEPRKILPEVRDMMEFLVSFLGNSIVRIQSEEQVRIRQDELNELYVAMEELVIVIDMDGTILSVNPAVSKKLGYREEELIGEPIQILYASNIRDDIIFQFLDLTESGGKISNTYPFLSHDGSIIPVETRGTMGVWGGRNVLFCISRDISERLKAEKDLHEYYERVQAILSSSTAQIYMKNADLRYLATNQPFIDALPATIPSVEGLTDDELFSGQVASRRKESDLLVINRDTPVYNIEEEYRSEDGSSIWMITSKIPLHDQQGKVTGIVGTSLDVTDLMQTRQELVKRDNILSAVSSVANILVKSEDWESHISECLALLGEVTDRDCLFLSRCVHNEGLISCPVLYDWWKKEPEPQANADFNSASAVMVRFFLEDLSRDFTVQPSHQSIPSDILHLYGQNPPASVLLLAINTSESFWGVLGFIDNSREQQAGSAELDALRTASRIIGSVIERSQTEELFHRPVERSLVGIYVMQDDHFVYVNPRMTEILGYPRETLEMMPFTLFFHDDDTRQAIENHHRVIVTADATEDYEVRAITSDGRTIYLENLISQFMFQGRPAVIGSIMDVTARKESESGLRQSLHEKDILLREVHHRVKNNMQIIVSLLRMQINMLDDQHVIRILKESKNRIHSMAMIHEKLYRTDNLVSINLLEYLNSLSSTMINDFSVDDDLITLDLICDPALEMTIDAGIPLGLIINELLTNTFKHGFSEHEHGTISISVFSDGDWLDITYHDTGKGLPEGFVLENCDSLGMQLIQNLVFQASGEMVMRSDHGIMVSLRIPMNEGFIIGEVSDATRE